MRRNLSIIILLSILFSWEGFTQPLAMQARLDQGKALLHIEIKNISSASVAILPAFQNYFFLSGNYPEVNRQGLFQHLATGITLTFFDSSGKAVYPDLNGSGDNLGPGTILERNSMWYENMRFFPDNLIHKRREGLEMIRFEMDSATCIQAGKTVYGHVKLHKAIFQHKRMEVIPLDSSIRRYRPNQIKMVVGYMNALKPEDVKDMLRPGDSLYQGWITSSDTIQFHVQ